MIRRLALRKLWDLLSRFPAVALIGPRQVGKTTLAQSLEEETGRRKAVYLDLELPSDRAKLADPELYFSAHENQLVILDEIHRAPEIFQTLRALIDRRRRQGKRSNQFLLLGSASIDLLKQSSESLAGRLGTLELTPFTVPEVVRPNETPARRQKKTDALWVRGGFPDSFLAASDAASIEWRLAFIQTYLERDVPMLGPRIPAETLHRFWQMLAHDQGQLHNGARLAAGLGVSGQTVGRYLDILVDLLLARRLQPWSGNSSKRLVRSPKVYVRDSGIVHALLNIAGYEQLLGHPVTGPSWEGFVIENLLSAAPAGTNAYFYRSSNGAEIDLILDLGRKSRWAIEVKRSISHPHPSKGFYLACEDVQPARRLVVYPGAERYPIESATEVIPLEGAMDLLRG
ncbi:MAG TPA: ATP-binding protein [Bryobacteraceae bacterium]|nr:ATP-binding protein [Bryobacteraceae bacterium]